MRNTFNVKNFGNLFLTKSQKITFDDEIQYSSSNTEKLNLRRLLENYEKLKSKGLLITALNNVYSFESIFF